MIVYDRKQRRDNHYVRVEMAANRKEMMVGAAVGGKPAFVSSWPVWFVPLNLLRTAGDLALTVEEYAKQQRVANHCDMSEGIMSFYKLRPGDEIHPPKETERAL